MRHRNGPGHCSAAPFETSRQRIRETSSYRGRILQRARCNQRICLRDQLDDHSRPDREGSLWREDPGRPLPALLRSHWVRPLQSHLAVVVNVDGSHIASRRAIVQTYMVIRCWRLLNCRLWFIIVAGLAIAVALAGALWSVSATCKFSKLRAVPPRTRPAVFTRVHHLDALYHGADLLAVFIPGQIWFWTSAAVDVLITSCLIYLFTSMKRRASKPCVPVKDRRHRQHPSPS